MSLLLQAVVTGILTAGVYALMSSGLVVTYGVMRVINLAQGAFVVLGAFLSFSLLASVGLDPLVSIIVTAPAMFALGVALEYLLLRRIRYKRTIMSVVMCWAMALGIEAVLLLIYGSRVRTTRPSYVNDAWQVGDVRLLKVRVFAFVLSIAVLSLLFLVLYRTQLGGSIRAVASSTEAATLIGINPERISSIAFGIGAATAAAGGAMLGMITSFWPSVHLAILGKLLAVVVLGGLSSLRGALVAALLLGVSESVVQAVYSPAWSLFPFYVLLLLILISKPEGLFGQKGVRTV